jgi:geranylgeranyl pyrophosphate synthase
MILYNCVGGKYFRGLLVLDTTKTLAAHRGINIMSACQCQSIGWLMLVVSFGFVMVAITGLDYSKLEAKAVALGWAIEVVCCHPCLPSSWP